MCTLREGSWPEMEYVKDGTQSRHSTEGVEKEGQELEGRGSWGWNSTSSQKRSAWEAGKKDSWPVGSVMGMVGCCGDRREKRQAGEDERWSGRKRGKLEASGESGVWVTDLEGEGRRMCSVRGMRRGQQRMGDEPWAMCDARWDFCSRDVGSQLSRWEPRRRGASVGLLQYYCNILKYMIIK